MLNVVVVFFSVSRVGFACVGHVGGCDLCVCARCFV